MPRPQISPINGEGLRRRDYLPVRRVAQACINCRRKKARCTGERPECSNCQRLFQECVYTSSPAHSSENAAGHSPGNINQMMERIDHLESCIGRVEEKLDRLLSMAGGLGASSSIPCAVTSSNTLPVVPGTDLEPDPYLWSFISSPTMDVLPSLPPLDEQLVLIDTYFTYCHNQPYSIFHEGNFRQRLHEGRLENHLLFAVIANSTRFASNSFLKPKYHGMASGFADYAWQAIITDCFLGTQLMDLSTVQTLTLLSIFDFTAGKQRHKSAWLKIGIAVRLTQDLHLMEEPDCAISFVEREERRRVFWSLFLLERLVSCGRGRPPAIMDSSCSLQLPCDEKAWETRTEQQTPTLNDVRRRRLADNEKLSPFSMLIAVASVLSQCAQYMLQKQPIGPENEPWHPKSQHASLLSDLIFLESQIRLDQPIEVALQELCYEDGVLKQHAAGPLVLSRLLFYLCQCLLFHPFLLREAMAPVRFHVPRTFWNNAKQTCRGASDDMIDLFHRAREAGCMLATSFCGYCLTVAATIQTLQATEEAQEGASPSLLRAQQCIINLEALGEYWSSSLVMSSKLKELMACVHEFGYLMNSESLKLPLEGHKREFFWSILDYSTISRNAPDLLQRDIGEMPESAGLG